MAEAIPIARLVEEHYAAIFRYGYWLTGSASDAEDVTQQVFLTAVEKIGQLRDSNSARSWLFTVARTTFLKNRRRHTPTLASNLDFELDEVAEELPDFDWPAGVDPEQLRLAVAELPPEFRLVLVMFYFEACSYREIADKLQLPDGTVMSRLSRAKSHLRKRLLITQENDSEQVQPARSAQGNGRNLPHAAPEWESRGPRS